MVGAVVSNTLTVKFAGAAALPRASVALQVDRAGTGQQLAKVVEEIVGHGDADSAPDARTVTATRFARGDDDGAPAIMARCR
jgi:hypothetical protein